MQTVSSNEARQQFSRLLERAYYQNETIKVTRNNRHMAWIIGDPFMQLLVNALEKDSGLADTLAIELNLELQQDIEEAMADIEAGRTIPLEDLFKD